MEEIKQELRQDSIYVKANAIEKLAYVSSGVPKNLKISLYSVEKRSKNEEKHEKLNFSLKNL